MTRRTRALVAGLVTAAVMCLTLAPLMAQDNETDPYVQQVRERMNVKGFIQGGGWVGYCIIVMSMAAVALIIEHFITLRRDKIIPAGIATQVQAHLDRKEYPQAKQACDVDDSLLAQVLGAGLGQIGSAFGFFDMQSAMQEASERQVAKLYRKLEYLSFISATAPLLGLLGTVTGMIRSFNEIALTEGAAKPAQLAGGVSEALITTCFGLVVAIPTMFFVALFRSRIDEYIAEAENIVEKVMGRFRKGTDR